MKKHTLSGSYLCVEGRTHLLLMNEEGIIVEKLNHQQQALEEAQKLAQKWGTIQRVCIKRIIRGKEKRADRRELARLGLKEEVERMQTPGTEELIREALEFPAGSKLPSLIRLKLSAEGQRQYEYIKDHGDKGLLAELQGASPEQKSLKAKQKNEGEREGIKKTKRRA